MRKINLSLLFPLLFSAGIFQVEADVLRKDAHISKSSIAKIENGTTKIPKYENCRECDSTTQGKYKGKEIIIVRDNDKYILGPAMWCGPNALVYWKKMGSEHIFL